MLVKKDVHITYCTNIHAGQNWSKTFESIKQFVPVIKEKTAPHQPFGLGLRLSNKASEELAEGRHLELFQQWLKENNVYVFTMNGFPYGNFHDERVKDLVHAPDWTTKERVRYTKRLFNQLAVLLPDGINGGISTSPISYKYWHKTKETTKLAFETGANNMLAVADHLFQIEKSSGTYLHLDIEPEPDGLIENSDEVLMFFEKYLVPQGILYFQEHYNLSVSDAEKLIKRYITVCYDICHFSLAYEEPEDTFRKLKEKKIRVGKIQVSAALKILFDGKNDASIMQELSTFNESTYLHQVTEKVDNKVITYTDLPKVLEVDRSFKELRAHFHVPIFSAYYGLLQSTQDHIIKTLEYLKTNMITEHLEIETYTWDVLPKNLKEEISVSISREIEWMKANL